MNFERNKDPHTALDIGARKFAVSIPTNSEFVIQYAMNPVEGRSWSYQKTISCPNDVDMFNIQGFLELLNEIPTKMTHKKLIGVSSINHSNIKYPEEIIFNGFEDNENRERCGFTYKMTLWDYSQFEILKPRDEKIIVSFNDKFYIIKGIVKSKLRFI